MAENSVDTGGSMFKQQFQVTFAPLCICILSLTITNNVLYRVVQKSLDSRGNIFKHLEVSGFCVTLYILASVYAHVHYQPNYLNSLSCTLVNHRTLARLTNLSY
jgi:hypothetical protein